MRRPITIRSLAICGAVVLAMTAVGCTADEPSERTVTTTPMSSDGPALPTASPPALDQLDLGAWGSRVLPTRKDAALTTGRVIPNAQAGPVDVTKKDGSWTLDIACVAGDGVALSVSLRGSDTAETSELPCASDVRAEPKVLTVRYDGGPTTTLSVTGDAEAVFVVQSARG